MIPTADFIPGDESLSFPDTCRALSGAQEEEGVAWDTLVANLKSKHLRGENINPTDIRNDMQARGCFDMNKWNYNMVKLRLWRLKKDWNSLNV